MLAIVECIREISMIINKYNVNLDKVRKEC